ncbi:TetR/AcrR family transcriptional regulator [Novipirellula aureliae]|nr:TetR/AcrR family transcriptional regulator [Novipirellula aureliae]
MKQGIYEAAVQVLTNEGLAATTMDRVAEQAGVSKGSLYNYFENKEDLLVFVYEKTVDPMDSQFDTILASEVAAVDKLRQTLGFVFAYLETNRGLFDFLFAENIGDKTSEPPRSRGIPRLAKIIHQGITEGVFRSCDPTIHATLLFGAICELCEVYVAQDEPLPVKELVKTTLKFCLGGLQKPER